MRVWTGPIPSAQRSLPEAILLQVGLAQLADSPVAAPQQHFTLNQSVRASVVSVDVARGRFSLALKHTATAVSDGLYMESLFASLEAAGRIRCAVRTCKCGPSREGSVPAHVGTDDA